MGIPLEGISIDFHLNGTLYSVKTDSKGTCHRCKDNIAGRSVFPVTTFQPGDYVLHVTLSNDHFASGSPHETFFSVVPTLEIVPPKKQNSLQLQFEGVKEKIYVGELLSGKIGAY
jgi:hypothetical protein